MPSRDYEKEFADLTDRLVNPPPLEVLVDFSKLFIDTIQLEPDTKLWTELSETFPLSVRLFAMDPANKAIRESLMSRLHLPAAFVCRWHAKLLLQSADADLAKCESTPVQKRLHRMRVGRALQKCEKLMSQEIEAQSPQTIHEFRRVLDSTHDFQLQLRILRGKAYAQHGPAIQYIFTREELFARYIMGVELGNLLDRALAPIEYEALFETLAHELRGRIQALAELPDDIMGEYPLSVQYRVVGEHQCSLMRIASNLPLKSVRAKAGELKDELGMASEAESKVALLKSLRIKLGRRNASGRRARKARMLFLRRAVRELPVEVLLRAMQTAEWEGGANLSEVLIGLFADMIPGKYAPSFIHWMERKKNPLASHPSFADSAFVRGMVDTFLCEMDDILFVAPDEYYGDIGLFGTFVTSVHDEINRRQPQPQ